MVADHTMPYEQGVDCPLMIETSGHGAMRENYYLDDGAYLAVKLVIEAARAKRAGSSEGLASLLDGLREPLEEKEARLKILKVSYPENSVKLVYQDLTTCDHDGCIPSLT